MSSAQLYDTIGATYTVTRRTEPRIAEQVWAALGDARTVLNVGAGTGSYEPPDRDVTAVEPSAVMRAQRPAGAAPCVAASAESLPFEDQSFDAAMAFATIDHWQDPIAGLREMRRVGRRVVVFTTDASDPEGSIRPVICAALSLWLAYLGRGRQGCVRSAIATGRGRHMPGRTQAMKLPLPLSRAGMCTDRIARLFWPGRQTVMTSWLAGPPVGVCASITRRPSLVQDMLVNSARRPPACRGGAAIGPRLDRAARRR
jgi:SAM-dependent methyltransferase